MLGLALAIALTGAAPEARPPANAMVAYNDGCDGPLQSVDSRPDGWDRSGWKAVEPKRGGRLSRYLAAAQAEAPTAFRALAFARTVQKRTVYLVLAESRKEPGRTQISCRLLDFDAPDDLSLAGIVPWAGRQPDGDIGGHGQPSRGHFWKPGLTEGHERTEIYYVPAASPLGTTHHLRGLVIGATQTSRGPAPLADAPAAPMRAMLDAFKAACSRIGDDLQPTLTAAVGAGWTAMAEDGDPRVARLIKMGREATEKDGTNTGATFRRSMSGQDIFLIVSRYQDKSGFWGSGCRLYHFEATRPLDGKILETWMERPPTGVQAPAPGVEKRLWEPSGWREGISVEVNHIPQNHALGKTYGLSGNILVAQAIGGF